MAVDLTTGSYDADGIFNKHDVEKEKCDSKKQTIHILKSLKGFNTLRILKECPRSKTIAVEGKFDEHDTTSIVVVEKMPFDINSLQQIFTSDSRLELIFQNNIYANYHVFPENSFNGIKVKVIQKPTKEDFSKFVDQPKTMIHETPAAYKSIALPHFNSQQSSLPWIKDVLHETKDNANIIFVDEDTSCGFSLIEEPKEKDQDHKKHFQAIAVCNNKKLQSIRDLTSDHLPLLLNIQEKCLAEVAKRYNSSVSQIETYVLYPPSHFQLHIIFQSITKNFSIPTESAHQLTTIISNLQLKPDYYQKVNLTYSLPEADELATKFANAGSV